MTGVSEQVFFLPLTLSSDFIVPDTDKEES